MSSKTTGNLIEDYQVQLVEPGCAPGSGRWGVQVSLSSDISAVFPYLNAVFNKTWYDHDGKVLIVREQEQAYALRSNEIRIARASDNSDARQITTELVEKINRIWRERDNITPRFSEKRLPTVIDIFKLLPRTNCGQCGNITCMAFAADLRLGAVPLEKCPFLLQPEYTENREKIARLFVSD